MNKKIRKILDNREISGKSKVAIIVRVDSDYRRKLDCIKKAENIKYDVDYIRQMIDAHYKLIKGDVS
ncbi:MAG: hypothetical protein KGZ71_09865 [Desulfobulbaceae bacterium]|nr:hypothetical protein [Desulfobulbaceae bacterium]